MISFMQSEPPKHLQLGELCERLEVRPRDARYVLEQGFVPAGVEPAPESGNYRQFEPSQAFWLGMVLKLKAAGIKTPLAAKIADYAQLSLRGVTQNLGWDWRFHPMMGRFDTDHQYYVDVADLRWIRFVTDANPSGGGRLQELDWVNLFDRELRDDQGFVPCAILRLDLTQIARLIGGKSSS